MKKLIRSLAIILSLILLGSCSDLLQQIEDLNNRLTRLEEFCQEMNTNITSLQTIVNALEDKDYITAVVPVKKGESIIGYTITFTKSEPITIYHGKDGAPGADGKPGHSPEIGVRQDEDGCWYWTLDQDWLLDGNGNKVKAEGEHGLTPELKIEDGWWYVRYGKGEWTQAGPATASPGEGNGSFFQDVTVHGDEVLFTLANGEIIRLPRKVSGAIAMDPFVTTATQAFFSGKALQTSPDFEVGILYSLTDDVLVQTSKLVTTYRLDKDSRFELIISDLLPGTKYFYRICTRLEGMSEYSEVMSFSTREMTEIRANDLSLEGNANCYIIPRAGTYKFKSVKGNSNESVGNVVSADVLWESYGTTEMPKTGSLIVPQVEVSQGWITFMTPDNYHEGNAVIAARNARGEILWSWHLWFTDQPLAQVLAHDAGIMMDRNLGATSAEIGSEGVLGLLYQWGRKDPFIGAARPRAREVAVATGQWEEPVPSSRKPAGSDLFYGSIAYATAHPMQLIYSERGSDWLYRPDHSIGTTRWAAEKTLYDPCPAGWRVPDGGPEDGIWAKAGFEQVLLDDYERGKFFPASMVGADVWYPAPGFMVGRTGNIGDFQMNGYYLSVTPDPDNKNPYCLELIDTSNYTDRLQLDGHLGPHNGGSVRCQKIPDSILIKE